MRKAFKQKLTSFLISFLLIFQTIIGVFVPVDISFETPFIEM